MSTVEKFLVLKQPKFHLNNVEKVNIQKIPPINATSFDSAGVYEFKRGKSSEGIRLSESYIEISFSYNTQTPAGTNLDNADITFENDVVSKLFDRAELRIGNYPIEVVELSNVATEMVGTVLYSTDEDRESGASMGWIPDFGAGSCELSLRGFIAALNKAIPGIAIVGNAVTSTTATFTNANINFAIKNTDLSNVNQNGYEKRKIFYNKPQTKLSGAAIQTARTCTLCVPLYHFFQCVTSYDKVLKDLEFQILLTRTGQGVGRYVYSPVADTSMTFITSSIHWVVPYYRLTVDGQTFMTKQLNSKEEQEMICLTRYCSKISASSTTGSLTYSLGTKANIPRYVLVAAKIVALNATLGTTVTDTIKFNSSLFTHGNVTDMRISLGSETYPYLPLDTDFPNNKYSTPFMMFRQFCKAMDVSPTIDFIDFRDRFTIFCFDLSARKSFLDENSTTESMNLSITRTGTNLDSVEFYVLQFLERHFIMNFASGIVSSQDRT